MLTAPETRIIDEARLYKSTLARAICNPFWDEAPQQDSNAQYSVGETDVSGSSVAEAAARSVCLLSFIRSGYEKHPVAVTKDEEPIEVGNIWKEKQLHSILFERGELSLEKYITIRFSGGKLDFSLIDGTHGFSLIDNENQNEFIDSFRKFEELDWTAVATDDGLDYKPIIRIGEVSITFQMTYGRKALRNSESLSGTGVSAMWRMVFLCVEV